MNRLRRLAAVLLNPNEDPEQTHAALEAAGVPVSFADCRNCPNPCEDGHEEYPEKISSMIDTTSDMLGSVKPYRRQVVISTGKSDWERSVTNEKGSLASYISDIEKAAPLTITGGASTPGTAPSTPIASTSHLLPTAVAGIFKDSENQTVSILNGSHDTLSKQNENETVLVFPDYKMLTEVPRSLDGAREMWRNSVSPSVSRLGSSSESGTVKSWVIPYTCVILIFREFGETERQVPSSLPILRFAQKTRCSMRGCGTQTRVWLVFFFFSFLLLFYERENLTRHNYCTSFIAAATATAVVIHQLAFLQTLQDEGWEVHTQLEDPTGPPLEDYADEGGKEAELSRRLQELDESLPKRALILKTSHIGGHKYAGNVIIYMPQGAGVWYGRVSTHEVASIVHTTILGGRILPPLLRGGVNLARPDCKRLNDW